MSKTPPPKTFPVLWQHTRIETELLRSLKCPTAIPWSMIEGHAGQASENHSRQTLERLAQRGGLSPRELAAVLQDKAFRYWRHVTITQAVNFLKERVAQHLERCTSLAEWSGMCAEEDVAVTNSTLSARIQAAVFAELNRHHKEELAWIDGGTTRVQTSACRVANRELALSGLIDEGGLTRLGALVASLVSRENKAAAGEARAETTE